MLPSASALASRREERVQKAFSIDHHGPGDARLSHRATAIYGEHSDYVRRPRSSGAAGGSTHSELCHALHTARTRPPETRTPHLRRPCPRAAHPARAYGMCLAYGRPTRLAPHGQMHINAATLLHLVQLPLAVASLPTGSIATLGRAPSAPIALHGRKLHQDSVSSAAEHTAAVGDSAIDKILVAAGKPFKGTYDFTSDMCSGSAICIDRSLTIEAQVPGSAVLDVGGTSLSAPAGGHWVFEIKSGGTGALMGPTITGGSATASSAASSAVLVLDVAGSDGESWMDAAATNKSTCHFDGCGGPALRNQWRAAERKPFVGSPLGIETHFLNAQTSAATLNIAVDGARAYSTDSESIHVFISTTHTGLDAAARVVAAHADLPTPHAPRTALCEDTVFGADEKLRDESSTDPIVPRGRCHRRQRTAPNGTDGLLHVVRVVHVQPGQRCAALGARDVPQVDPGAVGARRAVERPLATKLARRRRQRAEELRLDLSLGVPDEGGPVRLPEALAHPAPVPDAGLGLREQRAPPLGRALAAHALHCGARRAGRRCSPTETEERQRLSTLHGRGLHAQAHRILLEFGRVCLWNAAFCFLVFAFWLRGAAVLGRALDRMGNFTSGCAKDRVSRLLRLGASLTMTVVVHARWCRSCSCSASVCRWALFLARQALGHSAVGRTHGVQQPLRVAAMHHRRGRGST